MTVNLPVSGDWVSQGPSGLWWGDYYKQASAAPLPTPSAVSASTGVNPTETSYSLYGHIIPLSVFGVGRIGGEIISGPWIENGLASFIISFGVPADPSGTRTLREIAFDSEVVWDSTNGFSTESFTYRFYGGTLTQAADSLETSHFGADAVAYRPQILLAFENLPLANTKFGKIPYVAAVIADASGDDVNLGEAFERLAYSPWVGYTSSQFETSGITDGLVDGGLIIAQDTEFLQLIQQFGRFYPTWDILQTDKLRIVDRGSNVTADIILNQTRLMDKVLVTRQGPDTVKKDLELSTIDPGADYTIVPSRAQRPRDPVAVTTSVGTDSAYLPAIMDSSTRASIVTLAKYHEEQTRKTISGTAMAYGLEIEPGALVTIRALGDDFTNETFKVVETLHGANYVVEFTAAALLKCSMAELPDPYWLYVVLLLGFEGSDESTGDPGMTDESPAAHGTGNPQIARIDTAQSKFGSSSLRVSPGILVFDSSPTDFLLSSSNSDQFTVECWVLFNTVHSRTDLIVGKGNLAPVYTWGFETSETAGEFRFRMSSDGVSMNVNVSSSGAGLAAGVWYHLAVDKDSGGKIRIYKNGVMQGSSTPADSSMHDFNIALWIGANPWTGVSNGIDGWIDELRITKGIARYASDGGFTVPTAAFPRTGTF
jgi:hypothetical protein